MPADPIGEDNPIEAILLTAFPNPGRDGCPGASVIAELGNQRRGRDDPAWSHIWNCSPCFSEFKDVRDARVVRVERDFARRRTRRNLLICAAAVALSSAAAYFARTELRSGPRHRFQVVTIDLASAGALRGSTPSDSAVVHLPKGLNEIHLTLDKLSLPGRYTVAILESESQSTAVALGSAMTQHTEATATLVVTLDLSEIRPGRYFLGVRHDANARGDIANYYAVIVGD